MCYYYTCVEKEKGLQVEKCHQLTQALSITDNTAISLLRKHLKVPSVTQYQRRQMYDALGMVPHTHN
jgi:hypothetical protein